MALETEGHNPSPLPSPQVVGNAFVEQYYQILHRAPESVYKFYHESSVVSRPDANGTMSSVTTMQGINEKILSMDYKDYKMEIKTADAQKSHNDGVIVLVTGCLKGKDNLRRKFTQTFFLAPQEVGYFVLNDIFQFTEESKTLKSNPINEVDDSPAIPLMPDIEPTQVSATSGPDSSTSLVVDSQNVVKKDNDTLGKEKKLANDAAVVVKAQSSSGTSSVSKCSSAPEDAPKKSYASILNMQTRTFNSHGMRGGSGSGQAKVYVPTNTAKVSSAKTEKQSSVSVVHPLVPEASGTSGSSPSEGQHLHEEVENHSIYVRNLPFDVTVAQIEIAFKRFGPIKHGGIQVKSQKELGHCFGFVEFQSSASMNDAIQASPVNVGGRQAVVEIKKTTTRAGSDGRGRFHPGRGGFRNESFRSRGNYGGGGGRAYGRNEYINRGDFSGRSRGPPGHGGDSYPQGRGGRISRQSVPNQNSFSN